MYKCNVEACSHNQCCGGKEISITYSECVFVVLVIQYAMCMHNIVLLSVACLALPCIAISSHNWQAFWKKVSPQLS
jgi:hypothetical protein